MSMRKYVISVNNLLNFYTLHKLYNINKILCISICRKIIYKKKKKERNKHMLI